MIRDGNRLMSPVMGSSHQILHLGNAVHITHLCMTVKLHSLLRRRIISGFRKITNLFNSRDRTNRQLPVKFIKGSHSFDFKECPLLHIRKDIRKLVVTHEHFHHDGIRKVCHCIHNDCLLISNLTGIETDYLSTDGNLAHLCHYLTKFNRFLFKVSSIHQIWIIRTSFSKAISVSFSSSIKCLFAVCFPGYRRFRSSLCRLFFLLLCFFFFLLSSLFFLHRSCMFTNSVYFLLKPYLIMLQTALLRFLILDTNFNRTSEPVLKHVRQIPYQRLLLPSGHNGIGQCQAENIFLLELIGSALQHISLYDTAVIQL